MLVNGLLEKIGFSDSEQAKYYEYKKIIGDKTEIIAEHYFRLKPPFSEVSEMLDMLKTDTLHRYTIDLLFVLDCTSYLYNEYKQNGLSDSMFFDVMMDIKYKFDECVLVKKVFGIYPVLWFDDFFKLKRVALGRLQYDIKTYENEAISVCGYTINKGDFILSCHIPSGSPLTPELCMDSFKKAYSFFNDKIKDGILPIICISWLLYPEYKTVFNEKSNTMDFIKNFKYISSFEEKEFYDAWRIFGMDYNNNINELPSKTTMQKRFIEYLKSSDKFGEGTGIMLFDGNTILTKNVL